MTEKIWVYRLLGALILVLASVLFGWKKIMEERRKLREAEALRDLVEYIAEQIEYTMMPLPEILASFETEDEPSSFTAAARTYGLREAWERCGDILSLPNGSIRKIFGEFSREIGRGYRKEELELCSLTMKRLCTEIERQNEATRGREKLYRTLPPLMALSLVLMLV